MIIKRRVEVPAKDLLIKPWIDAMDTLNSAKNDAISAAAQEALRRISEAIRIADRDDSRTLPECRTHILLHAGHLIEAFDKTFNPDPPEKMDV